MMRLKGLPASSQTVELWWRKRRILAPKGTFARSGRSPSPGYWRGSGWPCLGVDNRIDKWHLVALANTMVTEVRLSTAESTCLAERSSHRSTDARLEWHHRRHPPEIVCQHETSVFLEAGDADAMAWE